MNYADKKKYQKIFARKHGDVTRVYWSGFVLIEETILPPGLAEIAAKNWLSFAKHDTEESEEENNYTREEKMRAMRSAIKQAEREMKKTLTKQKNQFLYY